MAHAVAESRAARRRERRLRSRFAVIGFGLVLAITGLVVDRWLSPNALPGSASAEATIRQDSAPGTIASRPASAPAPARPSRASTPNDVERYSTLLAKDLDAYDASVAAARDPATRQRSCARADSIYLSVLIDLQMLDLAFRQAGPMVDANAFQRADQLTRRGYLITPALEVPACRQ
jgi:hypothetical protein